MLEVPRDDFFAWAERRGVVLDDRDGPTPRHAHLMFRARRRTARFWAVPEHASAFPHFAASMLDGLGPWRSCRAWFPCGHWPRRAEPGWASEEAREAMLGGMGIPVGFPGAIEFTRAGRGQLLAIMATQLTVGGCVLDDFYVVPDRGQAFLMVSHHDVVHAHFERPGLILPFVRQMEGAGYRLPTRPPDPTFWVPGWMARGDRTQG